MNQDNKGNYIKQLLLEADLKVFLARIDEYPPEVISQIYDSLAPMRKIIEEHRENRGQDR